METRIFLIARGLMLPPSIPKSCNHTVSDNPGPATNQPVGFGALLVTRLATLYDRMMFIMIDLYRGHKSHVRNVMSYP
jgi:hypothetical protein